MDHSEQRPCCLLSIDLEAWFHARLAGPSRGSRSFRDPGLPDSVDRLLEMLDRAGARATFFVLGSVARTHPELIRRIAVRHEVASHGETHRELRELDRGDLEFELGSSRARLQDLSGQPVIGFRAPNWSMAGCEELVLPLLAAHGYAYDSSLVPGPGLLFLHGAGTAPSAPYRHPDCQEIWEFPPTAVRLPGLSFPLGGSFLRLLPGSLVRNLLERARRRGTVPSVHLHPWELPSALPSGVDPLRRLLLACGSRSIPCKLADIFRRYRVVAFEELWRRLAAQSPSTESRIPAVGQA